MFDNAILKDLPDANIRLTLGHNEAILKIVAGGIGMSCISRLAIEPLLEKGQLVILDTPFWQLTRPVIHVGASSEIPRAWSKGIYEVLRREIVYKEYRSRHFFLNN